MGEGPEQRRGDGPAARGAGPISPSDPQCVTGFDALWEAAGRCARGTSWKDSVAHFMLNRPEEVSKLCDQLADGTYRQRPPKVFEVTCPKRRQIMSVSFRDRVYQRSLTDNAVYPAMSRSWIYDNCACQRGKGTDFARRRLRRLMGEAWRRWGPGYFVATADVSGYYPNMPHAWAEERIRAGAPPWAAELAVDVLRSQYPGDAGYLAGSQLVQIVGVSALDPLDHVVKERMRVRGYVRYMDDMVALCETRGRAEVVLSEVTGWLEAHGFRANPRKTRAFPVSRGLTFLGFTFRHAPGGHVVMQVDPRKVKEKRRHLRSMVALSRRGGLPREVVDESYGTWRSHALKGDNHKLVMRMDRYYKSLWEEE